MSEQPLLYSIAEAASQMRVSRWTVRRLISSGDLKAVHIGRRVLLPRQTVMDYIERSAVAG